MTSTHTTDTIRRGRNAALLLADALLQDPALCRLLRGEAVASTAQVHVRQVCGEPVTFEAAAAWAGSAAWATGETEAAALRALVVRIGRISRP